MAGFLAVFVAQMFQNKLLESSRKRKKAGGCNHLIRYVVFEPLPWRESYSRPYAPKTNFSITSATAPALLSAWQT